MKPSCFLGRAAVPAFVALSVLGGATRAAEQRAECSALRDLKVDNTNFLSSAVVQAKGDLPEYCRVLGYVRPAINFEVRLPTKDWNGKFYMSGCGGSCGQLPSDSSPYFSTANHNGNSFNYGLSRNYAVSTMDGGHWGKNALDRRWAYQNPVARFDFEERAVTEAARVTKDLIMGYYGSLPKKSYFAGCSNGGRQGHMEAWKYPNDFDAVISGAPALHSTQVDILAAWEIKANSQADGKNVLGFAKVPMIAKAAYATCADEGGLIADPMSCHFQPRSLQCQGAAGQDCLTAAEVSVVERWYAGPTTSTGEQITPGFARGTELYWTEWPNGADEKTWRVYKTMFDDGLRYYGFVQDPGSNYSVDQFDFDRDPALLVAGLNRDAGGTDLAKFRARGGKILIWHGLADEQVPAEDTRDWYEHLTKAMGGAANTRDFARLFLAPGMSHCGSAQGLGAERNGIDPLSVMEKWAEEGVPPETVLMTKRDKDGKIAWARPVCAYPQMARYGGSGDWHDAANWVCRGP
jgi:feruloyl esterase